MYSYLFGNTGLLPMYDLIGILGYLIIIGVSFSRKRLAKRAYSLGTLALYFQKSSDFFGNAPSKREKFSSNVFLAKKERLVLFIVHMITYTFGGELFGSLIGRRTDFLGYVGLTTIAICAVCYLLGCNVLKEVDDLVSIFLSVAALLKLGCLCAGCCYGMEWAHGFYNHFTERNEFPIQLVESLFYVTLLVVLTFYKKRIPTGYLSPLFLIIYASFRFLIQFFRTDQELFSPYHFISVYALISGLLCLFIVHKYGRRITSIFSRKINIPFIESQRKS